MRILSPERTRRALWFMYARLTSTPLHTAYAITLLLTTLTLLSLHLASLTATHASLNKLTTLIALASPGNGPVVVPSLSDRDGQPVLQLCNVGQSDCQVISSVAPSATASSIPDPPSPPPSGPTSIPATTAQESNAQITPAIEVGVQGNGIISVSSASSFSAASTSSADSVLVAAPVATASSASSSGLFIADITPTTTAGKEASRSSSSLVTAPTLVLLDPSQTKSTSTKSTSKSTEAQSTRTTKENTKTETTTSEKSTETKSTTSTLKETSTARETSTTTLSTSTSESTSSTLAVQETTSSTSTSVTTAEEVSSTSKSLSTETSSTSSGASATTTVPPGGAAIEVIAPEASSGITLPRRGALRRRTFSATAVLNETNGALSGIDVVDVGGTGSTEVTRLRVVCALAMSFPELQLRQYWMEDVVLCVFYLWLAGVGVAAIHNESIPHLMTVLFSSLLSLLWSATQLLRTRALHSQFDAFITRGACSGVDVLPLYWTARDRLELPTLILNAFSVLVFSGLSFFLLKAYRKQSAPVNRYVYKVILILRIAILHGMFFLGAATVLWTQQLFAGAGASTMTASTTITALKGLGIISLLLAVPLGVMGWWALHVEEMRSGGTTVKATRARWGMAVFLVLDVFFVAQWTATFASDVYREVFMRWTFFAALSVGGFFLLVGSLGAGVVCWMRFGRVLLPGIASTGSPSFAEKGTANNTGRSRRTGGGSRGGGGDLGDGFEDAAGRQERGGGISDIPTWDYSNTAEKAWEPFYDHVSIRQSQFTSTSSDRQSVAFSYGLRSPAPPMPARLDSRTGSFVSNMS